MAWGTDNKPVTITEHDIEHILTRMGDVLTAHSQSDLMEQFRKLVRVESELAQERATVQRLNTHIAQLEARVQQLSGFLNSAMNVGNGASAPSRSYPSGPTTLSLSSFSELPPPPPPAVFPPNE